jgi:transposase
MPRSADHLPDDIDALKVLLAEQHSKNDALSHRNDQLSAKVFVLQEQLNLALAKRYAASSEKVSPDQIYLFGEAEAEVDEGSESRSDDHVTVGSYTRKKGGRKPLPATLPRVDIVHELAQAERHCPHDGAVLEEIGEEVSEQLDIVPAKIQVLRHIRKKYACGCGQCIKTAPRSSSISRRNSSNPNIALSLVSMSTWRPRPEY